jgi:hypothetical protein
VDGGAKQLLPEREIFSRITHHGFISGLAWCGEVGGGGGGGGGKGGGKGGGVVSKHAMDAVLSVAFDGRIFGWEMSHIAEAAKEREQKAAKLAAAAAKSKRGGKKTTATSDGSASTDVDDSGVRLAFVVDVERGPLTGLAVGPVRRGVADPDFPGRAGTFHVILQVTTRFN